MLTSKTIWIYRQLPPYSSLFLLSISTDGEVFCFGFVFLQILRFSMGDYFYITAKRSNQYISFAPCLFLEVWDLALDGINMSCSPQLPIISKAVLGAVSVFKHHDAPEHSNGGIESSTSVRAMNKMNNNSRTSITHQVTKMLSRLWSTAWYITSWFRLDVH